MVCKKSLDNNGNPTLALTIVDFRVEELIFLANYDIRDKWKSRESMGVEIEPSTGEATGNVSSMGVQFNIHKTCALKKSQPRTFTY
jgi:hypothetical protein